MKMGQYDDAVKVFSAINRLKPEKKIWWEAKAYTQNAGGNVKGAIQTWQHILDQFGFDEILFFKMLDASRKSGNIRQTEQSLRWLTEKFPYETRYLGMQAAFYVEQNKGSKAMELWNEILRIEPGNGEVHFELANYYRSRGEDRKAFEELLFAFKSPNLNIDAKIVVLLSYYNLTEKYPEMLPEAYQLLKLTIDNHPENPRGWSMYADYLFRDDRFSEALEMFNRVVDLDSTKYPVWEQLLNAAFRLNDFTTMRIQGAKALRLFPDQAPLYLMHGIGLLYGSEYQIAIEILNRGYFFTGFSDTISSEILHLMARAYELNGDGVKAADHYKRAVAKDFGGASLLADQVRFFALHQQQKSTDGSVDMVMYANDSAPLIKMASLWKMATRKTDASALTLDLSTLLQTAGDYYLMLEHAGDLYEYLGMKDEAKKVRQQALLVSKGNIMLQLKLEEN